MAERLKRKIDNFLIEWRNNTDKMPLIVKGARQVGKTEAIENFSANYKNFIEINFALEPKYKNIFNDGFSVDNIIKNITLINPSFIFEENNTLIFFDEMQDCINCATALKSFKIDNRYDVICSGSLMGINYNEIASNSVGYKQDYEMQSLDFEEFLWAKGYRQNQIDDLLNKMLALQPLSELEYSVMIENFMDYTILGGMPKIVFNYINNKSFSGSLNLQKQLLNDYKEDITKYAKGVDKGKILNVYNKIPIFLAQDNKKFQISKIEKNARSRNYIGTIEWLENAGIINTCYCLQNLNLPLKSNFIANNFKVYFKDTGLLIAMLDDEAQEDLRNNKNFNIYKGALYENLIAESLSKQGYLLYFYKPEKSDFEIDFFVRDKDSLIPIEVKANNGETKSLNKVLNDKYDDIKYGIKFCNKNIGFNGKFYTFPYFLSFLLKRYLLTKVNN